MTALRPLQASWSLLVSSAVILLASGAHATTCSQDSDCPKSFTCEAGETSESCAEPACPAGQTCPVANCTTATYKECVPGPCSADTDCDTGMVCYSQSVQDCPVSSVPVCAPNTKCPSVDPAPCTTKTISACIPKYDLPCTTDASCGDGFTCVADQECGCSGSGGGGSAAADASAPVPGSSGSGSSNGRQPSAPPSRGVDAGPSPSSPSCSCTTLATSHCVEKQIDCKANVDCPTDWLCEADPSATSGIGGCTALRLTDGGVATGCDTPPPAPAQLVCVPPYSDLGVSRDGAGDLETNGDTFGSGTTSAPKAGAAPTGTNDGGSDTAGSKSAPTKDSGGCEVGIGHVSSSGASLLGLLGLFGLARRRRSRAA